MLKNSKGIINFITSVKFISCHVKKKSLLLPDRRFNSHKTRRNKFVLEISKNFINLFLTFTNTSKFKYSQKFNISLMLPYYRLLAEIKFY